MSKRASHPHLRGHRSTEETRAIWELAREGRPPEDIARAFAIDAEGVAKLRQWQQDEGIGEVRPVPKACRLCGCVGACR